VKPARYIMSKLMQITPQRTFPKYTRPNLRFAGNHQRGDAAGGLLSRLLYPLQPARSGRVVIDLLERNGLAVEVATTECCGVSCHS